jgi:hypothetical protein
MGGFVLSGPPRAEIDYAPYTTVSNRVASVYVACSPTCLNDLESILQHREGLTVEPIDEFLTDLIIGLAQSYADDLRDQLARADGGVEASSTQDSELPGNGRVDGGSIPPGEIEEMRRALLRIESILSEAAPSPEAQPRNAENNRRRARRRRGSLLGWIRALRR